MLQREFAFPSSDGKTDLHAVDWVPDSPVRAVLQISHGVSEYILRYQALASFLTERGIAVAGHDHLGHGTSVSPGAPRLYFGPRGSWDLVEADLFARHQLVRQNFPNVPVFLMGHSMGSFLARTFLIRHPGAVEGAIIMGTGQPSSAVLTAGAFLMDREARRKGTDTLPSTLAGRLSFAAYNRRFAPNRTDFDWLSRNPENVDRYLTDPLCGGMPTTGLFREMLHGLSFLSHPQNLRQMDPGTPVLFLSGAMDPVGNMGKEVRHVCAQFRQAGVRDVTCKLYPQLRHEILFETCRETVYSDLSQWLEAHLPAVRKEAAR